MNDMGVDIEVFHGENSIYIDNLLDTRGIKHNKFKTDKYNKTSLESAIGFYRFCKEAKTVQNQLDANAIIWFGNMETAMAFDIRKLIDRKLVLNVLELYNVGSIYDKWLKKYSDKMNIIISCESHRAAIMESRYLLKSRPYVIPNKIYDLESSVKKSGIDNKLRNELESNFVIVYQGLISKDRPLENIAKALAKYNENILFLIMGDCSDEYKIELQCIYSPIIFTGFIPAPEHLEYTKYCNVGIANYDKSSLNNVFCAPNKIFEYAKYAIPVLASNNVALEESIGLYKAGKCIDFNDINQIINALNEISRNYDEFSENALKLYESINVELLIKDVVNQL